jgi:hypothetical protein
LLLLGPKVRERLRLIHANYSYGTDTSSFNVEVDPKRIEVFENEEPPPYEPTDVAEKQEAVTEGQLGGGRFSADPNTEFGYSNPERGVEVVEEDAREEWQAAATALATAEAESSKYREIQFHPDTRQPKGGNSSVENITQAAGMQTLWPAVSEGDYQDGDKGWAEIEGGFTDAPNVGEPSMEEFFNDQMLGGGSLDKSHFEVTDTDAVKDKMSNDISFTQASRSDSASNDKGLLSLLPQKTRASSNKSRRPKIRPSARKKNAANK